MQNEKNKISLGKIGKMQPYLITILNVTPFFYAWGVFLVKTCLMINKKS